jgi:uncharacterized protein YyaL (SSP411 family)
VALFPGVTYWQYVSEQPEYDVIVKQTRPPLLDGNMKLKTGEVEIDIPSRDQLYDAMVKQFYINGKLFRSYQTDKNNIAAYSEDYVSFIDALIHLYKITFDENVLKLANEMCLKTIELFYNPNKHFFRFSESSQQIIVDKYDINDDVINSSNSIMAHNLWTLSWYFDRSDWREMVSDMLSAMNTNI